MQVVYLQGPVAVNKKHKTLDKLAISTYINNSMSNIKDDLIIKWFIDFAISRDWNQSRMAKAVGRTRGWASLLVQGKITTLNFDTRNRIKSILGMSQ